MNWLMMYLDVFSSMPITTTVASVSIIVIVGMFVLSFLFDLFKHLQDYWDRYETVHGNAFDNTIGKFLLSTGLYDCRQWKTLGGAWARIRTEKMVDELGDLSASHYDNPKKFYLYSKHEDGRYHCIKSSGIYWSAYKETGFDDIEELAGLPMRYSIVEFWLCLSGALILATVASIALDILLFNFFLQTVVVVSVVALIAVVLKGGRALTDLKKSIAKLNENKQDK